MNWREFNTQYLNQEIYQLWQKLQCTIHSSDSTAPLPQLPKIEQPEGVPLPTLEILCKKFGLCEVERDVLLLCVAAEIDLSINQLLGQCSGDNETRFPTLHLALNLTSDPGIHAFNQESPIFYWNIVEVATSGHLISAPLKIQPWALQYILGYNYIPPNFVGALTPKRVDSPLESIPESYEDRATELLKLWTNASTPNRIVQLIGPDADANQHIAEMVCTHLRLSLYTIDLDTFLRLSLTDFNHWLLWWHRRAILQGHVLLIHDTGFLPPDRRATLVKDLTTILTTTLVFSSDKRQSDLAAPTIDIKPLTTFEQKAIWQDLLGETEPELPLETLAPALGPLVSHFNLNAATIHTICGRAIAHIEAEALNQPNEIKALLWQYCRTESRSNLEGLVERIEPKTTWNELVLTDESIGELRQIISTARRRDKVQSDWKMGGDSGRGMGLMGMFFGPPGTGKTTAAEIIALELGLDLYRVDVSQVSDKYIGETEKKLKKIFDESEKSGALLVFDEADSLIGKRTDVKDSKDRYANQSTSYLLQRMEAYIGIAILTTNLPHAIDAAFLRRMQFKVRFEYPTLEQRLEIWKRQFPKEAPIEGLSFQRLAQLNVSGAIIRNIAKAGAYLAADEVEGKQVIRMQHLLAAAWRECLKQGRPITDEEIRGWV
jgi:ATP-dependent 26S proteasome regulatory subunit